MESSNSEIWETIRYKLFIRDKLFFMKTTTKIIMF